MAELTPQSRVEELIEQHGGLRAAARAVKIDPGYFCDIRKGRKNPSPAMLRRMGLRVVVTYERRRS